MLDPRTAMPDGPQPASAPGGVDDLLAADEPLRVRIRRRIRGIGLELALFFLLSVLFPLLAVVAVVIDFAAWGKRRKPWMAVRLLALTWWFLLVELRGALGLLRLWLAAARHDPGSYRTWIYRLRHRWLCSHFAGLRTIFGIHFEVDGLELAGPGPLVMLLRHASTVDTLLPEGIIAESHDLGFRYVLKRELLALPTIDIGRRWCPTTFVRRGSGENDLELEQLRKLPRGLSPEEGILIYPEGTLFTPEKLARAQQIIAERRPSLEHLAARLRHVLPPRPTGTWTLLQAADGADVVICGHVGLARFEYPGDIWRGDLVASTVRIKFWRYPAADIPVEPEPAFAEWLYERWLDLDDWIDGHLARIASSPARAPVGSRH